jgi:hypothetical protein
MDKTIDMAREAGILSEFDTAQDIIECGIEVWLSGERGVQTLERFAALVASAEREACAKVCDDLAVDAYNNHDILYEECAAAIRARGEIK